MSTIPSPDSVSTARGVPPFSKEDYALLRRHVVSMRNGQLHKGPTGDPDDPNRFQTNKANLDALLKTVKGHIDAERRAKDGPARIMLHAHGGLVTTASGLDYARAVIPWWLANGVYPIFFVWESGLWNTISDLLARWWDPSRELYPEELLDPTWEMLFRNCGGRAMWTEMKADARGASDDDHDGGAALFAAGLGSLLAPLKDGEAAVHAVGHSAGSVFLGHLLEMAKKNGVTSFESIALLAPAMRVDLFKSTFVEAMKTGQVKNLSMFTMTRKAEHKDTVGPYQKSLLYLVSRAFEAERGAAILGLQEVVLGDPQLRSLFGEDNSHAPATVVWAPTLAGSPRPSDAEAHGDFDNDQSTMQSVAEDIIGRKPTDFPADRTRGRSVEPRPAGGSSGEGGPQRRGAQGSTKKALCIGIDDYPSAPLTGCVADARLWAEKFTALGFDVTVLINEQATTGEILRHLTELVAQAHTGDVVAFQYSGHGTEMPDLDHDEQIGNPRATHDQALIAHGAALGEVILDDDLAEIWDIIREGANVTAFFDSCHAGDSIRGEVTETGVGTNATIEFNDDPTVNVRWVASLADAQAAFRRLRGSPPPVTTRPPVRAILFSACKPDEVAYESGGHGVFTRAATPLLSTPPLRLTNAEFAQRVGATIVPPRTHIQTPGLWEYQNGFAHEQLLLEPLTSRPSIQVEPTSDVPPKRPQDGGSAARDEAPAGRVHAIADFLRSTADLLESE